MARADIDKIFPKLKGKDIGLSPEDFNNNCLAYALGDLHGWWEPDKYFYWPPGFPMDMKLSTVESIIKLHGYTVEWPLTEKPPTDAIAIYGRGGEWLHFAKCVNGHWCSKLGEMEDVERIELGDLEIDDYGKCLKVLRRPDPT